MSRAPVSEPLTNKRRTKPSAQATTDVLAIHRSGYFDPLGRRPRLGGKCFRGEACGGTLMRHLLPSPLAIAALALRMGKAASTASLKALTGRTHGFTARGLRALLTAVEVAPVTVAADHHLSATTGAVEQACTAQHRLLLPMRAGFIPNRERYFPAGRASHGGGAASGGLWRSEPVPRLSQRP